MPQKRRVVVVVAVIAALVLLNAWRWWPEERLAGAAAESARTAGVSPEALRIRGLIAAERMPGPAPRDLFAVVEHEPLAAELVQVEPERPRPAPRIESSPAADNRMQPGPGEFRLDGTLVRNGRAQAFLSRADAVYRVHAGDRLDNRFLVESVERDHVVLSNLRGTDAYTIRLEE